MLQDQIRKVVPKLRGSRFAVPIINRVLHTAIPLYAVAGIKVESVSERSVSATIPQNMFTKSHLGSVHAGSLYTLGEMLGGILTFYRWADRGYVPIATKVCIELYPKLYEKLRSGR